MTTSAPDDEKRFDDPVRSSRDRDALTARLQDWLRGQTGDAGAEVVDLTTPSGSGMSSETLLFDLRHESSGQAAVEPLVARVAPDPADVPVFPSYDLELQFRLLELVGEHCAVPVPRPRWLELDEAAIGSPFFVMDRVEGRVPADIPPYVFEGWLLDASPESRRELQDQSVRVISELSTIDVTAHDTDFLEIDAPGATPLRRHLNSTRDFYDWTRRDRVHPIIEETFAWLDANWPDESPTVISWGDARIGNIMYASDGFAPVAVLDWEMAALAPVEVDLGWMTFLHRFFQSIAEVMELPGLPGFMEPEDVLAVHADHTGRPAADLAWFEVYSAIRHAVVMSRIMDRNVRFGQAEWPDDVDSVIPHRAMLQQMIS